MHPEDSHAPQRLALAVRVLGAVLVMAGCAGAQQPQADTGAQLLDGVAARVNEHVITVGDVYMAIAPQRQRIAAEAASQADYLARVRREYDTALNELIDRKLIVDAFKAEEAQLPEWAIDRRQEEIVRDQFGDDFNRLRDALQADDMTMEEWRQVVRERLIVESMRAAKVNSAVRVNPTDVRAAYGAHEAEYQQPARVRLRMIVIAKEPADKLPEKRERVRSVYSRLLDGEDFAALARELSSGSEAKEGGDWGWVNPEELRPELARVARALPARGISEPLETDDDFYILQVEERQPGSLIPFDEVATRIERRLRAEKAETIYRDWMDSLRKNAYITVFPVDVY